MNTIYERTGITTVINLDNIKKLMSDRDHSFIRGSEAQLVTLSALADEVPGLVSEIESLRDTAKQLRQLALWLCGNAPDGVKCNLQECAFCTALAKRLSK